MTDDPVHATPSRLDRLLARLDLASDAPGSFIGGAGPGGVGAESRLFGGLVVAQAAVAAIRTAPDMALHALHARFVNPGRPQAPIRFEVAAVKDGRRYAVRSVMARQQDRIMFMLEASFGHAAQDADPAHQDPMPDVAPPESLPNRDQLRGRRHWQSMPIDVRMCDGLGEDRPSAPRQSVWMRPSAAFPDRPELHIALLAYASDRALLSTAWRPHAARGRFAGASLDHALWLHAPVRFDDWLLLTMHSPAAGGGHGLAIGGFYDRMGRRIATVAQEGTLVATPSAGH